MFVVSCLRILFDVLMFLFDFGDVVFFDFYGFFFQESHALIFGIFFVSVDF